MIDLHIEGPNLLLTSEIFLDCGLIMSSEKLVGPELGKIESGMESDGIAVNFGMCE